MPDTDPITHDVRQVWLVPFHRSKRNYENVGCLPYALEHDRGFSGKKLYTMVKQLPDGRFHRILTDEGMSNRYDHRATIALIRAKFAAEGGKA